MFWVTFLRIFHGSLLHAWWASCIYVCVGSLPAFVGLMCAFACCRSPCVTSGDLVCRQSSGSCRNLLRFRGEAWTWIAQASRYITTAASSASREEAHQRIQGPVVRGVAKGMPITPEEVSDFYSILHRTQIELAKTGWNQLKLLFLKPISYHCCILKLSLRMSSVNVKHFLVKTCNLQLM